jgi:hypothetical protein
MVAVPDNSRARAERVERFWQREAVAAAMVALLFDEILERRRMLLFVANLCRQNDCKGQRPFDAGWTTNGAWLSQVRPSGQLSVIVLDWVLPKATSSSSRASLRREGSRAIFGKGAWDGFIDDSRVGCVCGHFFSF